MNAKVWDDKYEKLFSFLSEPEYEQLKENVKTNHIGEQDYETHSDFSRLEDLDSFPVSFGKYNLLSLVGRGGMGKVYLAQHKRSGRKVAVKVIVSKFCYSPYDRELARRFQREWKSISKIRHPNVIQIIDVGSVGEIPYYSMEYLPYKILADGLSGGPRSATESARTVFAIATGLSAVHNEGVVHRDISPNNIVEGEDGPKLIDFGLAKDFLETCTMQTKTGAVMGTVCFMSPEITRNPKEADFRSDIFSLGAVFYNLLVGVPPFTGHNAVETMQSVQDRNPIDPSKINPDIPVDLSAICLKCLEKLPSDRYSNAMQLGDDLERFLGGKPVSAKRPGVLRKCRMFWRRNQTLSYSLVSSFLVLTLLIGFFVRWNWLQLETNALDQIKSTAVTDLTWQGSQDYSLSDDRILREFRKENHPTMKSRLGYVLGDQNQEARQFFTGFVLDCSTEELALLLHNGSLESWLKNNSRYWKVACDSTELPIRRLHALAVLAKSDPEDANWQLVESFLVQQLLTRSTVEVAEWSDLLGPVLLKFDTRFRLKSYDGQIDAGITVPLVVSTKLSSYDLSKVKRLVSNASPVQFRYLLNNLPDDKDQLKVQLDERLAMMQKKSVIDRTDIDRFQIASCFLFLLKSEICNPRVVFERISDPTIEILVAKKCAEYEIPLSNLVKALESTDTRHSVSQRLLLMACSFYSMEKRTEDLKERICKCALDCIVESPNAGVHYTAKWMLKKWGLKKALPTRSSREENFSYSKDRNWFTTKSGYEMTVIRQRYRYLPPAKRRIKSFAPKAVLRLKGQFLPIGISCKELTWEQYSEFARQHGIEIPSGKLLQMPVENRTFLEVATFCNWLTVQDGIGEEEQCFKMQDGKVQLVKAYKKRKGYRFATYYEHHNAIGEFGFLANNNQLGPEFAWYATDLEKDLLPPGRYPPNYYGLFDICGNAAEWSCGNGESVDLKRTNFSYCYTGLATRPEDSFPAYPYSYGARFADEFQYVGIRLVQNVEIEDVGVRKMNN